MITMPLYFEQFHNAFRIEQHLYGLSVNIYDFTPNELSEKINTVLFKDKQYRENCQQASAIVKGLSHPSAIAADWIEHVMKFGGDHLRSAAMDMNLYEFLMLDILAFVFGAIFFMVLFIVLSVKMLSRKYFSSDTLKQKINWLGLTHEQSIISWSTLKSFQNDIKFDIRNEINFEWDHDQEYHINLGVKKMRSISNLSFYNYNAKDF